MNGAGVASVRTGQEQDSFQICKGRDMRQLAAIANNEVSSPLGLSQACSETQVTSHASGSGAGALWNARMVRPLTDRTASMAKLDAKLPPGFADAIQHLVDTRNQQGGPEHKRLYARDLNQEAISELSQRADAGEKILFLAPPSARARKSLWVDESLKAGVDRLATEHSVTRAAVVMTALHNYLRRWNMLDQAVAA